jgi:plastocyanin
MKLSSHLLYNALWALTSLGMLYPGPGRASIITNVQVGDIFFAPKNVSLHVGDKVRWYWAGNIKHSTTSNTGLWDSGLRGNGSTFTNTFNAVGNFPYHCTIHSGQVGAITVQALASVPLVTINSPANGTTLAAPATFTLSVTATNAAGAVTNVQFFLGANSLGNLVQRPYSVTVTNLVAGDYTLSAVASGDNGLKATNTASLFIVTPAPITLSLSLGASATIPQLSYTATAGLTYFVERSADLINWTGISTNLATSGLMLFEDTTASASPSFYRVGLLSNP